jgi:hypothetical protein
MPGSMAFSSVAGAGMSARKKSFLDISHCARWASQSTALSRRGRKAVLLSKRDATNGAANTVITVIPRYRFDKESFFRSLIERWCLVKSFIDGKLLLYTDGVLSVLR